jgi:hypothetical protein
MMILPEAECAFFFAAMAQLAPEHRPIFAERVVAILDACAPICAPGPGDVDRAIRAALVGLWTPPPLDEPLRAPSRFYRSVAPLGPVQRHRRIKPGFGYVPA